MPSYLDEERLRKSVLLFSELINTYNIYCGCTGLWVPITRNATLQHLKEFEEGDKAGLAKIMEPELNKIRKELGLTEMVSFRKQ